MRFGFAVPGRGSLARPDVILMMDRFAEDVRPKTLRPPTRMAQTRGGSGSGAKYASA
jgi:hypothetical protein